MAPLRPVSLAAVERAILPDEPPLAPEPVDKVTSPALPPWEVASLVVRSTPPVREFVPSAVPPEMITRPPSLPVPAEAPASNWISPPVNASPSPALMRTFPPRPPAESPDANRTSPDSSPTALPDATRTAPDLPPSSSASAVWIAIPPLVPAPDPLEIWTRPPISPVLVAPAEIATAAPLPSTDGPAPMDTSPAVPAAPVLSCRAPDVPVAVEPVLTAMRPLDLAPALALRLAMSPLLAVPAPLWTSTSPPLDKSPLLSPLRMVKAEPDAERPAPTATRMSPVLPPDSPVVTAILPETTSLEPVAIRPLPLSPSVAAPVDRRKLPLSLSIPAPETTETSPEATPPREEPVCKTAFPPTPLLLSPVWIVTEPLLPALAPEPSKTLPEDLRLAVPVSRVRTPLAPVSLPSAVATAILPETPPVPRAAPELITTAPPAAPLSRAAPPEMDNLDPAPLPDVPTDNATAPAACAVDEPELIETSPAAPLSLEPERSTTFPLPKPPAVAISTAPLVRLPAPESMETLPPRCKDEDPDCIDRSPPVPDPLAPT